MPDIAANLGAPEPGALAHGDLLWPKGKNKIILYLHNDETAQDTAEVAAEKRDWEDEQRAFCGGDHPDFPPEAKARLCSLSYEEFRADYGSETIGLTNYALLGVISVGHVAIVDATDHNDPWVIEALRKPGVVRGRYSDWAAKHHDDLVWHGRLGAPVAGDPEKFVDAAKNQLGRPYDFWNFDLLDTAGFYCSKLVWYAAFKAFGVALDGEANHRRGFWYSPRQITRSPHVQMLSGHGNYIMVN